MNDPTIPAAMRGWQLTGHGVFDALIARAVEEFDGLDVPVNDAGGLVSRKTMAEMDLAHRQAVMKLNLTTAWRAVKAALPHLRAGGAIVSIASQAGRDGGGPGSVAYATAKGAVMTMTRALAKELGPDIRVTAVNPGMIDTDFHSTFTEDAVRVAVAGATPLKREGRPHEVADLVTSLASDRASFVDGACIDINGGLVFS